MATNAALIMSDAMSHHDQHQYLTFVLGREVFALEILAIREILEYSEPTDIPMMPPFVRGVVNLRGAAVPVIDLSARFNRARGTVTKRTCIVIVEIMLDGQPHVVGAVVDAVNEVLEIPTAEVEPPPRLGLTIRADFIKGMGKVRGKFVVILDAGRVLSAADINAIEATLEAGAHAH